MRSYLFAGLAVLLIAAGQLLFKYVAQRIEPIGWMKLPTDMQASAVFVLSLAVYGIATIVWIEALRLLPLSRAYVVMAGAFIIVPIVSSLIFNEPFGLRQLTGVLLIAAGILLSTIQS